MAKVDIKGLSKAAVLAALFNASKQQGMGILHGRGAYKMTPDDAEKYLTGGDAIARAIPEMDAIRRGKRLYFDYLEGRVLKVDITDDEFESAMYDRDIGVGAAQAAIDGIRRPNTDWQRR